MYHLFQLWQKINRPIGALFSMLIDRHKRVLEVFDKLEGLLNGVRSVFPGVT